MPAAPTNVQVSPTPVDSFTAISWTLSTDDGGPGGNSGVPPQYAGDISTDNGANWTALFSGVAAGTSQISLDLSGVSVTTQGLVRVRFSDGFTFSSNTNSAAFTVTHAPRLLFPVGGETFAITVPWTIKWSPAADPSTAQTAFVYQLQITTNLGAGWADIVNPTGAGVLSFSYNFSGLSPTGQAQIRVRSKNPSGVFSAWSTSVAFNLITEVAPSASTGLKPTGGALLDDTVINRFSWQFNCLGDIQSKFDFKYSTNGGASFTTVTKSTANPFFDAPPLLSAPAAATMAAGAAGTPNGTYKGMVTFVTDTGETVGGAEATVTVTSQSINWPNIPIGPAGTTARKLYRTAAGGATGTEKLAQTISDNTTTTFTGDNVADGSLGVAVPTQNTSGFPTGPLLWKVATYNNANTVGPDSAQANVQMSRKPATPTITAPGGTVTQVRPTMTWTFTAGVLDAQVVFTARVTDANGVELWNSGAIRSTQTSIQIGVDLPNGATRLFKLTIQNADGFTSLEASVSSTVSLSPPPQATIVVTQDKLNGRNIIVATNPAGAPAAIYNELWRVESGGPTVRTKPPAAQLVAAPAGRALNGTYYDYQIASGVGYQYFVRTYAATGTFIDSALSSIVTMQLGLAYLHDVTNPVVTSVRLMNLNEDDTAEYQATRKELQGNPVQSVCFGQMRRRVFRLQLPMALSASDYSKLAALFNATPAVICFRDTLGNKVFAALGNLPAGYGLNLITANPELYEVAYSESA